MSIDRPQLLPPHLILSFSGLLAQLLCSALIGGSLLPFLVSGGQLQRPSILLLLLSSLQFLLLLVYLLIEGLDVGDDMDEVFFEVG